MKHLVLHEKVELTTYENVQEIIDHVKSNFADYKYRFVRQSISLEKMSELATIGDNSIIKNINKDINAHTKELSKGEKPKINIRNDVAGGSVSVPRYLYGLPDCMRRVEKKVNPFKIVNLLIDISYCWAVKNKEARECMTEILKRVVALERKGYRLKITALITAYSREQGKRQTFMFPLKKESERLNIARFGTLISEPKFFRTFGFSILSDFVKDAGLGCPLNNGRDFGCNPVPIIANEYFKSTNDNVIYVAYNTDLDSAFGKI